MLQVFKLALHQDDLLSENTTVRGFQANGYAGSLPESSQKIKLGNFYDYHRTSPGGATGAKSQGERSMLVARCGVLFWWWTGSREVTNLRHISS